LAEQFVIRWFNSSKLLLTIVSVLHILPPPRRLWFHRH